MREYLWRSSNILASCGAISRCNAISTCSRSFSKSMSRDSGTVVRPSNRTSKCCFKSHSVAALVNPCPSLHSLVVNSLFVIGLTNSEKAVVLPLDTKVLILLDSLRFGKIIRHGLGDKGYRLLHQVFGYGQITIVRNTRFFCSSHQFGTIQLFHNRVEGEEQLVPVDQIIFGSVLFLNLLTLRRACLILLLVFCILCSSMIHYRYTKLYRIFVGTNQDGSTHLAAIVRRGLHIEF